MMKRQNCALQVGRMLMDIVDKSRRDNGVRSQLCEHNLLPRTTRLPTRQPTGSDFAVACLQTFLWLQMPSWLALRGVQRCLLMQRLHSICAPCWEVIQPALKIDCRCGPSAQVLSAAATALSLLRRCVLRRNILSCPRLNCGLHVVGFGWV